MALSTMMLPVDEIGEIFHDVTPLPQNDGPNPVCVIQYPSSFIIAYDYMRACWKSGEKSERSLKLSATCLKLNPANYTVWHYRRVAMDALGYFDESGAEGTLEKAKEMIELDLQLAAQLGGSNPKNYQIWYHRRALLEAFDIMSKANADNKTSAALLTEFLTSELAYIAGVLEEDSKNYHAWSHRQWLIRTVNESSVWDQEVEYAHELIRKDPRNNSAWNQRWFACHRAVAKPLELDMCRKEANFAIEGATMDPYNESPFRYLIGILREQSTNCKELSAEFYPKVEALQSVLVDAQRNPEACANWTSARIDLLEAISDDISLTKAMTLAEGMAERYDTIRNKYWKLRINQIKDKLDAGNETTPK